MRFYQVTYKSKFCVANLNATLNATHLFSKNKHFSFLISFQSVELIIIMSFIFQLKDEILSSYQQITTLCSQLRQRPRRNSNDSVETSSSSEEVIHSDSLKKGALNSAPFFSKFEWMTSSDELKNSTKLLVLCRGLWWS
jgi:hypothetical protein